MKASQRMVLDNLVHRWPYNANLAKDYATEGLAWAIAKGYVENGRITDSGRVELLRAGWKFDPEDHP